MTPPPSGFADAPPDVQLNATFRRTSIVVSGSRAEAAKLRGVGRFIVAGRLPIPGKTVGRTGGAIFLASFHII